MSKPSTSATSQTDWERVESMQDEDIDLSEIPEVTEEQMGHGAILEERRSPRIVRAQPDGLLQGTQGILQTSRVSDSVREDTVHNRIVGIELERCLAGDQCERVLLPRQSNPGDGQVAESFLIVQRHGSLHEAEHGLIFVGPSKYLTLADPEGDYSLFDVPPGRYRLRTWNDALSNFDREITLRPGEMAWREILLEPEAAERSAE